MFSPKRVLATAGAVAVAAIGLAVPAGAATAATANPQGCAPVSYYSTWDGHHYFIPRIKKAGNKGIVLRIKVGSRTTVTTKTTESGGGGVSFSVPKVVASAHANISHTIVRTVENSQAESASYKVTASYGWLAYGAWGYTYKWDRGYINLACKAIVVARGTAKSPAHTPGFDHS